MMNTTRSAVAEYLLMVGMFEGKPDELRRMLVPARSPRYEFKLERQSLDDWRMSFAKFVAQTAKKDAEGAEIPVGAGIDEDPVTGSTHCCLGPFWGERLGKNELTGYQASARGGVVRVRVDGDRVILGGKAVTIWQGELV